MPIEQRLYKVYEVEVTQDDINYGVRRYPYGCPIAIAIKKKFNADYVFVGMTGGHTGVYCVPVWTWSIVRIGTSDHDGRNCQVKEYQLSSESEIWMGKFDRYEVVEPFVAKFFERV